MQDITASGNGRWVQAGRVDLTPMVDLGFLLITFFIFTTTMSTQTAMKLLLPADSKDSMKVAGSGAITLYAHAGHIGFAWGAAARPDSIAWSNRSLLREKLLSAKNSLVAAAGNDDKLFVQIKPAADASFGQVVDLLDEMTICGVRRYALVNN
jgi:biopolymer transport protein ExbD